MLLLELKDNKPISSNRFGVAKRNSLKILDKIIDEF